VTKPARIQLSRKKGWRMPPNTLSVARPGGWGNPFVVGKLHERTGVMVVDRAHAVELYREAFFFSTDKIWNSVMHRSANRDLRGFNLACWCPLDEPCHADLLLEIANR